jgi:hypothetical protein
MTLFFIFSKDSLLQIQWIYLCKVSVHIYLCVMRSVCNDVSVKENNFHLLLLPLPSG